MHKMSFLFDNRVARDSNIFYESKIHEKNWLFGYYQSMAFVVVVILGYRFMAYVRIFVAFSDMLATICESG